MEKISDKQNIANALQKMDEIIIQWFRDDPLLLGSYTLCEKVPDPKQKTMGLNTRTSPVGLHFNPNFINTVSKEQLEFVLTSECLKILLKHPTTRFKKPEFISNTASQITINHGIMNQYLKDDDLNFVVESSDFKMEEGKWLEYYFRKLMENVDFAENKLQKMGFKKPQDGDEKGKNKGKGKGEKGEEEGEGEGGFREFKDGKDALKEYMNPYGTSNSNWGENDLFDADVQNMVQEKKDSQKNWGKTTANFMGSIIAANEPKLCWKDIVRRFRTSIMSSKQYSSRMKVNRRYDLLAPGKKSVYKSKLIYAVDVSGSMGNDELAEAFAVINSVCRHSQIEYVLFDTEIKHIEKKMKNAKKSFKITGRGGTSIQCVIDYAEKQKCDGVILHSDMEFAAVPKPKHLKVLWLGTNKKAKTPCDWGMSATLEID